MTAGVPPNRLQIALEHHRAGRLRQAEAIYRELLDEDPNDPHAAHWLGVLMYQAGKSAEAVPLLERGVAGCPDDAAYLHNLGQACMSCGRHGQAILVFDRALESSPDAPQILIGAALARLARKAPGDAERALELLARARDNGPDSADLHYALGVAQLSTGHFDQAVQAFSAATQKKPDHAEAHYQLGVTHRLKGNVAAAQASLSRALEIAPSMARAAQSLAVLKAESGNLSASEELLRQAIAQRPDSPVAYQALSGLLRQLGRVQEAQEVAQQAMNAARGRIAAAGADRSGTEAVAELERKITPSPANTALHYQLALEAGVVPPGRVPVEPLTNLYQRYADRFDEHLRGKLQYEVPELMARAITAAQSSGAARLDVLDLGCGTGLCGPLLRPLARTLVGVDLAAAMIDNASERQVYDELHVADLLEFLRERPGSFDVLAAADVLIYLGELALFFELAAAALRPDGLLAFSVESCGGQRFQLNPVTHRFAHSEPYLKRLVDMYGFQQESFVPITIRLEAHKPVEGYLVVLRKSVS